MSFTEAERSYVAGQLLGRLATVGSDGTPQVRPLGFPLNSDTYLLVVHRRVPKRA